MLDWFWELLCELSSLKLVGKVVVCNNNVESRIGLQKILNKCNRKERGLDC